MFIKLKSRGKPVQVSVSSIMCFRGVRSGTLLVLTGGAKLLVKETPDQIIRLLQEWSYHEKQNTRGDK